VCVTLLRFYCSTVYLIFICYFIRVYIVTVFFSDLWCSSSVICLCNRAVSFCAPLLLNCIVTLVRLSLVTIKGYLLACFWCFIANNLQDCTNDVWLCTSHAEEYFKDSAVPVHSFGAHAQLWSTLNTPRQHDCATAYMYLLVCSTQFLFISTLFKQTERQDH